MGLAQHVDGWSPAPVRAEDRLTAAPGLAFSAALDQPAPPTGTIPPLWHWFHFLDWPPTRALGPDGHPLTGHFLPPLPDRRRMIAGGRVSWRSPLRVGRTATRTSTLQGVEVKTGRTGDMVFVTVRHEISQDDNLCLVEEQDTVYRSGDKPRDFERPERPVHSNSPWQLRFRADPALLFRVSALTANSHRIHYDERYARRVERYPGLVVHGPLLALLMAELPRRAGETLSSLRYRLKKPVFLNDEVLVAGGPDGALSVVGAGIHAEAEARFD
ncbi:FAS1-like dehydratase domain-containing protein [Actinokineospora bangkokensis]|uniref:FAS1-like dehydratase domain-containing protein n=1 Tax=Actinokineospora bangkokensis TaxID=1193682 RepID=A0A1Q9LH52_9PSEU|nr:MaoC family dehydratase N-terminal domain-containing protein [Actinokineospora bangkokensis]OLR91371.1 hypothetical protein BJP25_27155 [Actinokineospora bangkokensis]